MKNLFIKFWPILFLSAIFILLFYKVFFFGQVFYEGDNFHLNIPEKYFLVQQITSGHLPLWNPYLFLGIPYLADFNLGTLNPTNIIYFLFPVPRALTLLTVFDFFGLSVGMYLLLRNFKLSRTSSVFGAIIMSLSGMPFVLLGNMTFMQVIVYIPFIFLIARKLCEKEKIKWLLFLVILQFFQFVAGHPQETYYTMFFTAAYLLLFLRIPILRRLVAIFFYIIFPLLLGGIQLLTFLEYVLHANRPVGSINYSGWGGLSLPLLTTFIFPTFYGSHLDGTWWGKQQILIGFMGIPTLIFIYIGVRFSKFREKIFISGGSLVSFLLAFGELTPLFFLFYYLVPGWKLFRAPSGILVFFTFFAAIAASFGLEYFSSNSKKFVKLGKILTFGGLILTIISGIIFFYANKSGFWRNILILIDKNIHKHILNAILFYDTVKIQQIFQGILWNIVFASILIFLTGAIVVCVKKYKIMLLVLLTLGGFLIVNSKVLLLTPISYYDTAKNVSSVLKPSQRGNYRIISIPVNLHQNHKYLPPANFFYVEGQANMSIHQYDNNIEAGLYQAAGYVSLVPESYAKFIGGQNAITGVTNIDFSSVKQQQLNLSSVRYIISHEPIRNLNNIPLSLLSFDRGKDYIYENKSALPRAYVEENTNTPVIWNKSEPTELDFTLNLKKSAHLIITDWYYPGWKAYVDGKEIPIKSFLNTFQRINLPSGRSHVKIVYDPLSLKLGISITVIGALAWVGLLVLLGKKKI